MAQQPTVPAKQGFTLADLKAQIPQDKDGAFLMELSEILNTATDPEVRKLLKGQPVVTTGQVITETEGNADGRRLRIIRTQLLCCAAHTRQCSVAVEFAGKAPAVKDKSWVRITGTMSYKQEAGTFVPEIIAKEIQETATPSSQLLK